MTNEIWLVVIIFLLVIVALVLLLFKCKQKRSSVPVAPPESCTVPPDRVGNVLKGVYHPSRLQVFAECAVAEGTVLEVKHEMDKDIHIKLKPDPKYLPLAKQGQDFIICEIIPLDQATVKEPQVGEHIHVEGPWCFDTIHGWQEIHPIWKLVIG